jgi:hypothetical protein
MFPRQHFLSPANLFGRKVFTMSPRQTTSDWRELYWEALRGLHPVRIEEAQKAIQSRTVELCHDGSPTCEEGKELDSAIYFLNLFAVIARSETEGSEVEFSNDRFSTGQFSNDQFSNDQYDA